MICDKFSNLSVLERILFIGELTHACMNDNEMYDKGVEIIKEAKDKGFFDNVKIMPTKDTEE